MKAFDKLLAKVLTQDRLWRMGYRHRENFQERDIRLLLTDDRLNLLNLRRVTEEEQQPLIQFFCEPQYFDVIPKPAPAAKKIPDWFKKIPAAHAPKETPLNQRDHFGAPAMTAKKCLPLLDAMTAGYIMSTFADMNVRTDKTGKNIDWHNPPIAHAASTHDLHQLGGESSPTYPGKALKFHNPWVIKTRPGYSTLFLPPLNDFAEERFTCMSAMVDTDAYPKQVNFPCVWHAKDYDGVVLAGTPLVLALPIRREDLGQDIIVRVMSEVEREVISKMERIQNTRSHYYTKELREER